MIKNCWLTVNGKTYFINESGVMAEGWQQVEGNYYYFYPGDGLKGSEYLYQRICAGCKWHLGALIENS